MATTFTTVTDWALSGIDPSIQHGGTRPAGTSQNAAAGKEWQRDQYTVNLYRTGVGMTAYAPRVGETTTGDNITWTGGGDTIAASAAYTYTCTDNPLIPAEPGFWIEQITWVWSAAWAEVTIES